MGEPARTVSELITVLYAVDAHMARVRLKSGGYLRGELVVESADREEIGALSQMEGAHVFTEIEMYPDGVRAWDCVETRGKRIKVRARSGERPATSPERALLSGGATRAINTLKGMPV